ncbi:MAG: pgm 1 [Planctomycetaceae bacterium]|nr:pgm 1 [Planctomycetaceae bacterium]
MATSPLAGLPAPASLLTDIPQLLAAYQDNQPDPQDSKQLVSFGTSGHRGTSLNSTFTDMHIAAITQAIVEYRQSKGLNGPLFLGMDTHALSDPAQQTALEVLAANSVETVLQSENGFTPTPVISHAILNYNRGRTSGLSDGIVITPSHNPPADGGFKYNASNGGPADTDITGWVQDRANDLLRSGNKGVKRISEHAALHASTTHVRDFSGAYIADLAQVIDLDAIRNSGLKMAVDPLGGASVGYWGPIAERYGLNITVVNPKIDPQFGFMTVDHDGKIRMDCSSPDAMAGLVKLKDQYDLAFGNDPDSDRHGIVSRSAGLMNPNHYLAVAIRYLFTHRERWPSSAGIGKTLVSSSVIDRIAADLGRQLVEVPVGFKWFVEGLFHGTLGFGGEESAGASFLRRDGSVWSTDKDGLILNLLAAEIFAVSGKDPGEHYREIVAQFGEASYTRIDQPATLEQKAGFKKLTPEAVTATELAGETILAKLTRAPGNNASIGGLKVVAKNGWFAARPSGTENIYKIYAESFSGADHLQTIVNQAREIVNQAVGG